MRGYVTGATGSAVADGRRLDVPVVAESPEEEAGHFGRLAPFLSADNPASSRRARGRPGWQPNRPGLIPDLDRTRPFET